MANHRASLVAWIAAVVVPFTAMNAVAGCPYANGPQGTDGVNSAYVKSQYGRHIGRRTRVRATPRETAVRSTVSSDYGHHVGTPTRTRTH